MTTTKAEELAARAETLAIAEALERRFGCSALVLTADIERAAAELRRLSAENTAAVSSFLAADDERRELRAERDALLDALNDAAQSLTTIAENAGRSLNTDGTENYLFHFDQVRGYARSRAGVAIDAARATGEHHE